MRNSTNHAATGSWFGRLAFWTTGIVLALVGNVALAQTYKADFGAEADLNERAILNGTTEDYYNGNGLHTGGIGAPIDIKFNASFDDPLDNPDLGPIDAFAYLDSWSGEGAPAGLGVCRELKSPGNVDASSGPRVNECFRSNDDNVTEGETLMLTFDFPVAVSGLKFRNADHVDISNTGDSLLVNGAQTTFAVAAASTYTGASITFAYGGVSPNQFYVEIIGDIRPIGSLGDRVWLDLDGDDAQDCSDIDNSGTVGDSTTDCNDLGFDGVDVALGTVENGVCVPTGDTTTTANGGFYLFDGLDADDYCVIFNKPAGYDCVAPDVGDDALDSDGVDNGSGGQCVTGTVSLGEGETNLSVDLGLVRPPALASLGDYVWEDLNGDGKQDGNEPAVVGVPVELGKPGANGACNGLGVYDATDSNGLYRFSDLEPGEYCVKFDLVQFDIDNPNYCTEGDFALGAPLFTTINQGVDATDSDAQANGDSESVTLKAGDNNLTLDAGIICPAKIGDYFWLDSNGDGKQNDGNTGVEGAKAELLNCDGTSTGQVRITDSNGMYMFGAEPDFALAPGCYKVKFTDPLGRDFTMPNADGVDDALDSDCAAGQTGAINVGPRGVDLSNDCGVVAPLPKCDLDLVKGCRVETPEVPAFAGDCKGKIQAFTLIWNGNDQITVSGVTNTAPGGVVKSGDEVTFSGPFSDNDVFVTIDGSAYSVFHMSCSDDDFDGPEDCGIASGDGKSNDSNAVNLWALEGFVDAENKVLDCNTTPVDGPFLPSCTFEAPIPPSCDNSEKPLKMTFEYTGGGCAASDNGQDADKAVCAEGPALGDADVTTITASGDDMFENDMYNVSYDGTLEKGDRFTIDFNGNNFKSTSFIKLEAGGSVEVNELHTSCSQPLAVGDVFGSLTLVGWDDQQNGVDVTYSYTLTNNGDDLGNISVTDDPLGFIGIVPSLPGGTSTTIEAGAFISKTTSNTATASTMLAGELCLAQSNEVTVEAVIPPCDIRIKIDDVTDDALKIKLRNEDSRNRVATLESIEVSFPADRQQLKEVKLDGDLYKLDDALKMGYEITGTSVKVGPGLGAPNGWTKDDPSKYQLDPGEERTLEIKTTNKSNKDVATFDVTLKFAEGCEYTFTVTKAMKGTIL